MPITPCEPLRIQASYGERQPPPAIPILRRSRPSTTPRLPSASRKG